MELRRYLAVLRAHWLLGTVTFVVTVAATLFLVVPQPWIYESSGSLRLQPSSEIKTQEDLIRAWANLTDPRFTTTYATVAQSDLIVGQAEATLTSTETSGMKVDAGALIDTTIITITVTGPDPEAVQELADAVMTEMVAYTASVDATYELVPVESPDLPGNPVGPNKNLQIILGVLFGAALAIALALFAEYVRRPAEDTAVTDPITGASNELYLRHRLREETGRTVRTSEPFIVATLRVEVRTGENDDMAHVPADRDLRRIARGLRLTIPDDAVLAYLGGGLFAALVPGMKKERADGTVGGWAAAVTALLDWSSQGELGQRLQLSTGVCEFRGDTASGSEDVEKLVSRLLGGLSGEEPGVGATETSSPERTEGPVPVPTQVPARVNDAAPSAPAMPPAPAGAPSEAKAEVAKAEAAKPEVAKQTVARPRNGGGNGGGNGAKAKPQPRKVTVIPDPDDDAPAPGTQVRPPTQASTRSERRGGSPPRAAQQEKGDAGDPTG